MNDYIMAIMICTCLGGGVLALAPKGRSKKTVSLLCSLCTVGCMLFPLGDLLDGEWLEGNIAERFEGELQEQSFYDEIYNSAIDSAEIENANINLKNQIIKELSVNSDKFDVNIIMGTKSGEKFISKVQLLIYKSGIGINPHEVSDFIGSLLGCECEVIYV